MFTFVITPYRFVTFCRKKTTFLWIFTKIFQRILWFSTTAVSFSFCPLSDSFPVLFQLSSKCSPSTAYNLVTAGSLSRFFAVSHPPQRFHRLTQKILPKKINFGLDYQDDVWYTDRVLCIDITLP